MKQKLALAIAGLLILFGINAQSNITPKFVSDSIEGYIAKGMADWKIPGLAIAIVKNGEVVMMKGFGVRDIATKEPVNEHTLFMIASNSKLFTGTALSQLQKNNKLNLNDKVSKYLPEFSLYDNNASDMVTIRDLLSHRIGTKTFQGDFVFWNSNLSRKAIINRVKLLKPAAGFRQSFGYCNSCFVTAAEVIPAVTRKPWEVYVYDSLLVPAGMTESTTLMQGISQQPNVSKPYTTQFTGELTELPYDQVDNIGAAGSMVSNVKDLSNWLLLQLDSGRLGGKQVIDWEVIRNTREMNTIVSSRKNPVLPINFTGYGLGVFMNDYAGRQVYYHTGGAFGFVTNTCFVPEEKLGIVILTNNDNQNFFEALRYQVLDAYLGVSGVNRSQPLLDQFYADMRKTVSQIENYRQRVKNAKPIEKIDRYAGSYENPLYGTIEIAKDETGKFLNVKFKGHNTLTATLKKMDDDNWLLTYNNLGYGIHSVRFDYKNDTPVSVDIKVNEFLDYDKYVFTKK